MQIVEQFNTLQGEGRYIGTPSHFIRTTGCNLRCAWKDDTGHIVKCDTPYTSWNAEKGQKLDVHRTLKHLENSNIKHIVISGGEPTIQKDLPDVCNLFEMHGYYTTVETNGTIHYDNMNGTYISCSPKLKNSYRQKPGSVEERIHEKNNTYLETIAYWLQTNETELKIVVNSPTDIKEVESIRKFLQIDRSDIYLMPMGITREQLQERSIWLWEICKRDGYKFSPRLHIDVFGNIRGV